MRVSVRPKLYHITHGANLSAIVETGGLLADSEAARGRAPTRIGMSEVVARRKNLPVPCHPNTCVGDYVPFYFCPRSVMLYVIWRGNHPSLTYAAGQVPIVHLEAEPAHGRGGGRIADTYLGLYPWERRRKPCGVPLSAYRPE